MYGKNRNALKMVSLILLENIEIYANHGVLHQETSVGNSFIINLKMEVDNLKACENDDLDETVNYALVYDAIAEEMQIPSKLLEHVAYRILNRLKTQFKRIVSVEIKLSKRNPPISGQIEYASVVLKDTFSD